MKKNKELIELIDEIESSMTDVWYVMIQLKVKIEELEELIFDLKEKAKD